LTARVLIPMRGGFSAHRQMMEREAGAATGAALGMLNACAGWLALQGRADLGNDMIDHFAVTSDAEPDPEPPPIAPATPKVDAILLTGEMP
jgi:hypothetical protein